MREATLNDLGLGAQIALPYLFDFWALAHQVPPGGDWRSWVILGGRGAGKTRAGSEWVRFKVEGARPLDPGVCRRMALVGETLDQVREVMVFGDSGILACCPPDRRPKWQASRRCLVWPNGAEAMAFSAQEPEALRWPQFDGAWADELGCPAVDKGTNQPNVFLDSKSSESALPRGSNGLPDEDIQRQYLRAMHLHWADPANNPVSGVYGGPMLDMSRAFVWAWDARPYPWFPALRELWADGENYRRGHWISGRLSSQRLASVVAAICERVGLFDYDVSDLVGMVRGYLLPDVADGRRALQPLMLTYGFDAVERDGTLVFRMREGRKVQTLSAERLAEHDEVAGELIQTRASEAEMSGRVRLQFYEAEGDHDTVAEEAVLPDERTHAVASSEVALTLTCAEGRQTVERWLNEARIARDTLKFALPPSALAVRAGDVVALDGPAGAIRARVDRVEVTDRQLVEAVRMEGDVYLPAATAEVAPQLTRFEPAVPVTPVFLDLPILTGEEVPHAPHFAAYATPWPGPVAVYSAPSDADYRLNRSFAAESIVGETESDLTAAPSGRYDRGGPLRVRLYSGALQSVSEEALLGGANALAIGDGSPGNWEVLQFRDAIMLGPDTWHVSMRLRGQAGTDGVMPALWPAGSVVVRLDGGPGQIRLPAGMRRQAVHFRIGPESRGLDDPTYVYEVHAFDGIGLRPYSPAHLSATPDGADLEISWIRRTRIDGDDWTLAAVPLAEEQERYLLQVSCGTTVLRSVETTDPAWRYGAAERAADLAGGPVTLGVAQISARFGPGPAATIGIAA